MDRREFLFLSAGGAAAALLPQKVFSSAPLEAGAIERRLQEILPQLSLWEKVSLMSGRYLDDFVAKQKGYGAATPFCTPGLPRFGLPGIRFIDGPRGINFTGSTAFPVAMARGASWDPALARRVGAAIGYEARAQGANFWGGLGINVLRHPAGGRAQETFGEDPFHLAVMGTATLAGAQEHVMACAKHYCCNNNEDSRFYVNVEIDERTLREVYLPHFKACVDAGVAAVMSAYNQVNGELCGHNEHLLRHLLKNEWGFAGIVVSDFILGVKATLPAIRAGLDIEMPGTLYYGRKLWLAVRSGLVPEAYIDDAVSRILRQQLRFLHLEDASGYDVSRVAGPDHQALCCEAAHKSIVLLKNQNQVLPLDPTEIKCLALIGELADAPNIGDRGSSIVRPPYVITPLAGLREVLGSRVELIHEPGKKLDAARRAAARADAVIVLAGLTWRDEGEGGLPGIPGDRSRLSLHKKEIELIRAAAAENRRCIVVLMGGSAITMEEWKEAVPGILMAWYPGMEGGHALADILMGQVNPSGRLPFVWPKNEQQCVPFQSYAPRLKYDLFHGYRYLDRLGLEPEFPFGFGLSYTSYRYEHLRLSADRLAPDASLTVSVDVTNLGGREGEEVVQVYVAPPGRRVERPKKELKAFAKVLLRPGETRTVSLSLSVPELAYYDVDAGEWKVEDGEYVVLAGPCTDERQLLSAGFHVS